MARKLSDLRTQLRALLNNDDFFGDGTLGNGTLDLHINTAFEFLYEHVLEAQEKFFMIPTTLDVVKNERLIAVPPDMKSTDKVQITEDQVEFQYLNYLTQRDTFESNQAQPAWYEIVGNFYRLHPSPQKSVTNGLHVDYVPNPVELVADDDTVPDRPWRGLGERCILWRAMSLARAQEETHSAGATGADGTMGNLTKMEQIFLEGLENQGVVKDEIIDFEEDLI